MKPDIKNLFSRTCTSSALLFALSMQGCAVIAVADAAITVGATAVSITATTVSVGASAVGAGVEAESGDRSRNLFKNRHVFLDLRWRCKN